MAVSTLKSVIISCKGGVPITRLNSDYRDLVGEDIPFKEGGGHNLQEYLLSIDGIAIENGLVKATSENTKHLEKLINKQKDKNPRKYEPYKKNYGKENTHPQYCQDGYKKRPKAAISKGTNTGWIRQPNTAPNYPKSSNYFSENQQRNYHEKKTSRPRCLNNGYNDRQLPPFCDEIQPNWDLPCNRPPQRRNNYNTNHNYFGDHQQDYDNNYYNNNEYYESNDNTDKYHYNNNNHNNYNNNNRFNSNNYENGYYNDKNHYSHSSNNFHYRNTNQYRTCRGNENTNVDYQYYDNSIKRNKYYDENQQDDCDVNSNYYFNYNSYKSLYGDYRQGYNNGNSNNYYSNNYNSYEIHYGDYQRFNRSRFEGGKRYVTQVLSVQSHNDHGDEVASCNSLSEFKERLFKHVGDERAKRQRIDCELAQRIRVKRQRLESRLAELDCRENELADKERLQSDLAGRERTKSGRLDCERADIERIEREHFESKKIKRFERFERERLEYEKIQRERTESKRIERLESERVECKRIEKERVEHELIISERVKRDRIEKERVECERIESERVERERIEKERVKCERIESEQVKSICVGGEQVEGRGVSRERVESSDPLEEQFLFRDRPTKTGPGNEAARRKKKAQRADRQKHLLGIRYTFNDRPQLVRGISAARRGGIADWYNGGLPIADVQIRSPQGHRSFRGRAPNLNNSGDFPSLG